MQDRCFSTSQLYKTGLRDICVEKKKQNKVLKGSLHNSPEISWRQSRHKFTLLQMQSWLILQSTHTLSPCLTGRKMVKANVPDTHNLHEHNPRKIVLRSINHWWRGSSYRMWSCVPNQGDLFQTSRVTNFKTGNIKWKLRYRRFRIVN